VCNMNFRTAFDTVSTLFRTILANFDEACCHFAPPTRGVLSLRAAERGVYASFPQCFGERMGMGLRAAEGLGVRATNRIQREFSCNVAIATSGDFLASSHHRQKTNLLKQFVLPPLLAKRGEGWGEGMFLRSGEACCHFAPPTKTSHPPPASAPKYHQNS
jgi:hypothetical protein